MVRRKRVSVANTIGTGHFEFAHASQGRIAQDSTSIPSHVKQELNAEHLGFKMFCQTIGVALKEQQQGISRSPPKNATPAYMPKLTKSGYGVSPSVAELVTLSEADLAALCNFKVWRSGTGSVEWQGAVDVRGADLLLLKRNTFQYTNFTQRKGTNHVKEPN